MNHIKYINYSIHKFKDKKINAKFHEGIKFVFFLVVLQHGLLGNLVVIGLFFCLFYSNSNNRFIGLRYFVFIILLQEMV